MDRTRSPGGGALAKSCAALVVDARSFAVLNMPSKSGNKWSKDWLKFVMDAYWDKVMHKQHKNVMPFSEGIDMFKCHGSS